MKTLKKPSWNAGDLVAFDNTVCGIVLRCTEEEFVVHWLNDSAFPNPVTYYFCNMSSYFQKIA